MRDEEGLPKNKAQRVAKAKAVVEALIEEGVELHPIAAKGQKIASSFWGRAWNRNLEQYEVYAERLPRGRSHLRAGAVIDFLLEANRILGKVVAEDLFEVEIRVDGMDEALWEELKAGIHMESMAALLAGEFSEDWMASLSSMEGGLFPKPDEIRCRCHCEDYADMCAHAGALLYACGVHLDDHPEDLFRMRGVNPEDLLVEGLAHAAEQMRDSTAAPAGMDLNQIFGLSLEDVDSKPKP